jgi:hypothetical protein
VSLFLWILAAGLSVFAFVWILRDVITRLDLLIAIMVGIVAWPAMLVIAVLALMQDAHRGWWSQPLFRDKSE